VVIVVSFFTFYLFDTVFRLQEISVIQKNRPVQLFGINSLKESNIFLLNERSVGEQLKRLNPSIKMISVKKEYPNRLYIEVTHLSPVVYLQGDPGLYLLAEDASILEKNREKKNNLPVINYYQKLPFSNHQAGEKLDYHDIVFTIGFLQKLTDIDVEVKAIDISGSHVITFKTDKQEILTSSDKDLKTQQYLLERIVKELRIKGEDFKSIDVRFEKAIYIPLKK
jgi:hypothetical protein